ncbi:energy transducer TonB [Rhodanobacter sp. DHG33]|uniref:energy transducer TonB n=1 Tax=Rhodanobacter sp. DHG33 TaxID=2775921 RepID=UPI00177C0CD8|nr:energy transducer TonB [Rhodanobacter sp. DHG33]MBD8897694.1 energy transducer TonB [Rhodanobacter sp. DHG33]
MNPRAPRLIRSLLLVPALACAASAWAQSAHRVGPENLYHYWIRLNTQVNTDLPNSGLNLDKPGCAAVTYTIGSDGVPMNVQLVKLVPKSDLGNAAVTAVKNFRYGPSLTNRIGQPIDTYYIVPFNAPDGADGMQKVMEPCKLPGYGQ